MAVNLWPRLGVGWRATAGRGRATRACTERQPIGLPHWPGAERRPFGVGATARRRAEGGLRRLRRVRPRPTRRPPDLPGPLRPPAPRAGVGGDRGGGRPVDHRRQGHGSRPQRLQRADARRAAGPLRHRPHPLLDHRRQHLAQRPARVPRGRRRPLRPRPQRQPDQHRDAGRRGGHAAGDDRERQRPHRRAAGPRDRGAGDGPGRCAGRGPAVAAGRVLARPHRPGPDHRGARPQRLPSAVPRSAGRRLGGRVGVPGPRHHRRPPRARARAGGDGGHRRDRSSLAAPLPARAPQPDAVRVRVRLLRPARRGALRPQRRRGARAHGRAAGRAGAHPAGPGAVAAADDGHAGAGERGPGRAGLRPDQRHPLRRRARQEPLHRKDVHRPQPGAAQPRRPPQAQPAAGEHRRQAPRGRR